MTPDTDHLLTFLAAGRQFDHDGQTWTIVEVQHGGTMLAHRVLMGDATKDNPNGEPDWYEPKLFGLEVLAGQSVARQNNALLGAKRDAIAKQRTALVPVRNPMGRGQWHPTVRAVDHIMTATDTVEVEALGSLQASLDEPEPVIVYGDFAADSPRTRKAKAIDMVNAAMGKKKS